MIRQRPPYLPEPVYQHDQILEHEFFAITGRTDQCNHCGCTVSEAANCEGASGGRFDQPCRDSPWKCDQCGGYKSNSQRAYGVPDVFCLECWKALEAGQSQEKTR